MRETQKDRKKWLEILDRNKTSDHGFEVTTDTSTIVYPTAKPTIISTDDRKGGCRRLSLDLKDI